MGKGDKLTMIMDANMSKIAGDVKTVKKMGATTSKKVSKELRTAESYFKYLEMHQRELNKDKVTVMMQVGSFYEVYGYVMDNGDRIGNVWDVANEAEIAIAEKKCSLFGNKNNVLQMAGAKQEYIDKYIDKLVDKCGWTIALYEQVKEGNGHTRVLKHIISPGIYFENDNISNVLMYVYIRSYKNRRLSTNGYKVYSVNYGIFYMDCISGKSSVLELYSENADNVSVEMSELLKIITIQNFLELRYSLIILITS